MPDCTGILTFHSAINYGAVLQAYALSRCVRQIGGEAELIDYRPTAIECQYRLRPLSRCTSLRNFAAHNLNCLCRCRRRRTFLAFQKKHLPLSPFCTRQALADIEKTYTRLITGSDQVFNPECHERDTAYLLDFVPPAKRNAYSASIGSLSAFEAWREEPLRLLADFSALSLREADAAVYLSRLLARDCPHTVDPVWLLSPADWAQIARPPRKKKPYILVYNLMNYPYMHQFAKALSAQMGLPIISISKSILGDFRYRDTKIRSNASPEEFLGYIHDAACVVTDSFHGTSFSMLFGRPFYAALDSKKENTNSRLLSLLRMAGLEEHAITAEGIPTQDAAFAYDAMLARMQAPIAESRAYLKSICSQD